MFINHHIDKILKSNEKIFSDIVDKIASSNSLQTQKELNISYQFNKVLYDSVEFTLQKLDEEEGIISRLLYNSWGIGEEKNQRRKQLRGLGGRLKQEIQTLQRDRKRINFYYENISSSFTSLERLAEGLGQKQHQLTNKKREKRCSLYIKELYQKMDEIDALKKELEMKSIYLESCIFKYKNLLTRIPRYKEIEISLQLAY